MDAIVFMLGILGSSLSLNGEEVWPPTLLEALTGYHLLPSHFAAHGPERDCDRSHDNVLCAQFYKPINDDLSQIAAATGAAKFDFFCNWRKDIKLSTAPLLAEELRQIATNRAQSITLVAHSMGGLVARILLESGDYQHEPWLPKIKRFVGICNPHQGSPQALAEALGPVGSSGIEPDDMPTLTSGPRYPAAYQNLTAPHYNRLRKQPGNVGLDIYSDTVASEFHLDLDNLAAVKNSFSSMDTSKRPASVEYSLIVGSQQSTLQQINVVGSTLPLDNAGDGTVPLWSAAPGPMTAFVTPGDHIGILKTGPFRTRLFQILTGGALMAQRFSARRGDFARQGRVRSWRADVGADCAGFSSSRNSWALRFTKATDTTGRAFAQHGAEHLIHYLGAPVGHLAPMQIPAPTEVGAYRLSSMAIIGARTSRPRFSSLVAPAASSRASGASPPFSTGGVRAPQMPIKWGVGRKSLHDRA